MARTTTGLGSFRACVDWVEVMEGDGTVRRIDSARPRGLRPICGAMGLTGVILRAAIRLQPVETAWIRQEMIPTESVDAAIDVFEENLDVPYSVAWIDCIGHPPRLGRSLVMLGRHATGRSCRANAAANPSPRPDACRWVVPFDLPGIRPECRDLRVFNAVYYAILGKRKAGVSLIDWDRYFYPLDSIRTGTASTGARGSTSSNAPCRSTASAPRSRRCCIDISEAGTGSFLSVLKRFGKGSGRFPSRSKATRWRSISRPMTAAAR
jgi:decaprenylphospho-beta-D-ribofuranose 2-oxidase